MLKKFVLFLMFFVFSVVITSAQKVVKYIKSGDLAKFRSYAVKHPDEIKGFYKFKYYDFDDRKVNLKRVPLLSIAAYYKESAIVNYLLNNGVDAGARDDYGATPLLWAAFSGDPNIFRSIARKSKVFKNTGMIYTYRDGSGYMGSALGIWALRGNLDMIKYCVEDLEMDVNEPEAAPDGPGWTPLIYALKGGSFRAVKYLVEKGADVNRPVKGQVPVVLAAGLGDSKEVADFVMDMVEKGADLNVRDIYGRTALHSAAIAGNTELVEKILSNKVSVNVYDKDGNTPLHLAAKYNHKDIVEKLLNAGARVNARNINYFTPLFYAVYKNNYAMVELLVENGANVNAKERNGYKIYDYAREYASTSIQRYLYSQGARPSPAPTYNFSNSYNFSSPTYNGSSGSYVSPSVR